MPAITETKKKGRGMITMAEGNILIYSGVKQDKRASSGVGCIINKKLKKLING